jgi:hypothetical protein
VWVAEADVYTPGMVDHALIPRTGASAPTGYIYHRAKAAPPGPPTPAPGTANLSFFPADITADVGNTFTVGTQLNVGSDARTAHATISYDPSRLTVAWASLDDSSGLVDDAWGAPTITTTTPGKVTITATADAPVSGDHPLALIGFTAVSAGDTSLTADAGATDSDGRPLTLTEQPASAQISPAPPPPAQTVMSLDQPVGSVAHAIRRALTPADAAGVPVGTQFQVPVYANISGGQVNAVEADVSYDPSLLQFVSDNPNASAWNTTVASGNTPGTVDLQIGATTPQSGQVLLTTITFQAIAPGTANLSFTGNTQAADATESVGTLSGTVGTTYTITP